MVIIAAVLIFGILIFVHELGHFLAAKHFNIKIHEFSIGMGPAVWKKRKGDILYSLRALPIGGFVKMEGEDFESDDDRAFNKCAPWKRIIVLIAGAFMNILLGFLIFVLAFSLVPKMSVPVVREVVEGSAAQTAGLAAGDKIVSINGAAVHLQSDVSFEMYRNGGAEAKIEVLRDGKKMTFYLTPQNEDGRYIVGYYPATAKRTVGSVLQDSFYYNFFVIKVVYVSLFELIAGHVAVSDMSGPVGIVSEIGQAVKYGFADVLNFAGLIAVNLGVMNMLPLPALDGGRAVFALIEMITRKKVKPEVEGYVHTIGFLLLIALMVFVTYSDIVKLIK